MPPTTYDRLMQAEEVEQTASEIYIALADMFSYDPEAYRLFAGLAAEEEQHELRLRMLRNQIAKDPRHVGPIAFDPAEVKEDLADAKALMKRLGSGREHLTFREACLMAAELEERMCSAHAHALAPKADPTITSFYAELARQDAAHARLLRKVAENWPSEE